MKYIFYLIILANFISAQMTDFGLKLGLHEAEKYEVGLSLVKEEKDNPIFFINTLSVEFNQKYVNSYRYSFGVALLGMIGADLALDYSPNSELFGLKASGHVLGLSLSYRSLDKGFFVSYEVIIPGMFIKRIF